MASDRLPPRTETNALTRAVGELRARRVPLLDLTESNPTTAGIPYPPGLLDALSHPDGLRYGPHPQGLEQARAAIAGDCARRGALVDPADIVLCASTSEAYSWLFKLLCNPGDAVLVPQPSYPLFEHLTRLEGVRTVPYPLDYHGRWEIDLERVAAGPDNVRAVLVVSPNNPTGSYVSVHEFDRLTAICRDRGWALIADEVFADYAIDEPTPLTDLAARGGVLTFTLAGASKTLGLPQVKLGWIVAGGPVEARKAALASLEFIADTFLSVATPVQLAASSLLRDATPVRESIHGRVRRNLERARAVVAASPAASILRVEGGWSAPLRVPAVRPEEAMVLALLQQEHVLVHPGYFFDFPHEAFVVVSLLADEKMFPDALARALRFFAVTI